MRIFGKGPLVSGLLATTIVAATSIGVMAGESKRIAFFVSDLSNVFHQSQASAPRGTPWTSMAPRLWYLTVRPIRL